MAGGAVPNVIVRDFWEGSDPGYTMARLVAPDETALTSLAGSTWSLVVTDLTTGANITAGQPGTFSGAVFTENPYFSATLLVDAYWGGTDDIGYNIRHYVRAADFNAPALLGGHSYRFEYQIVTPTFATSGGVPTANAWGPISFVREGTCRELKR